MLKSTCWTALGAALIMIAGCSGDEARPGAVVQPEGQLPPALAADGPLDWLPSKAAPPAPVVASGLPALSALDGLRTASISGPGWQPLNILHPASSANSLVAGAFLQLEGSAGLAYAVFGVDGFDGDSFPTSLKVTLDSLTGQYYVGFSDYVTGCWQFAGPFNGSAEVQLPQTGGYTSPTAYVSAGMTHYCALFTDTGAALKLSGLELGVHGGTLGPQAPPMGGAEGGDAGCTLAWLESMSSWEPDFAGYVVQRAPLLSGDYTQLTPGTITDNNYFDPTAVAGVSYRWRVAAVDVSGNLSAWTGFNGGGVVGDNVPPVVIATLPQVKLYGPLTVSVDFSASFDPDGDAITGYQVFILGGPVIPTSLTPVVDVPLQPGCYQLMLRVHTAAGIGMLPKMLKVYPQWGEPQVVREPDINMGSFIPGLFAVQLYRDPVSGEQCYFGYDFVRLRFALYAGGQRHEFPGYAWPVSSGEPVAVGGTIYFPFITSHTVMLLSWTPAASGGQGAGQLHQVWPIGVTLYDPVGDSLVAAAQDASGHLWVFYAAESSGQINLYAQQADGTGSRVELISNIVDLQALDAEFNPATGKIEIISADPTGMYYAQFDPALETLSLPELLDLAGAAFADLEINPATNRPLLLYRQPFPADRYLYTERDTLATWGAPVLVDNSLTNEDQAALEISGGNGYALFALADSQGRLYELDMSGCTVRNTPATYNATGNQLALQPGAGGVMYSAWRDISGKLLFSRLNPDGSSSDETFLDQLEGQGIQMFGATGGDGLHALFVNMLSTSSQHLISADGGSSWVPQPPIYGIGALSMANDHLGNVYMSYYTFLGGTHELDYWDPGTSSWVSLGYGTTGVANQRSILGGSVFTEGITWLRYDTTALDIAVTSGDLTGGFFNSSFISNLMPLWDGAVATANLLSPFNAFTVGGGSYPSGGYVGFYESAGDPDWLFSPPGNAPHDLLTNAVTAGNAFGIAQLSTTFSLLSSANVCYATHGPDLAPLRYLTSGNTTSSLPLPASWGEFYERDLRRTLSVTNVGGITALAAVCSLDAAEQYMEWSSFGQFEELPFPGQGSAIRPALMMGADGRWHMLYRDKDTDQIMCVSTL